MTKCLAPIAAAAAIACCAAALRAQQPPPVRQIGPILAVSHDTLASVSAAVHVAGGRVYVNDITAHRVLLYDSTLGSGRVIVDSGGSAADAYGTMPGTLLPYHRDSALLVTPASLAMLVLSPEGTIVRVLAMPPSGTRGLPSLIGNIFGTPGFDAAGRLAYFSPVRMTFRGPPDPSAGMSFQPPDSALIVRFDFAARTVDTVGAIRIPRTSMSVSRDDQGRMHMSMTALPLATVDDWAVTSDGRIAIVRGRDYHVDWLGADGAWSSTPRVQFAWEQLDDARKQVLIDSAATAMQAAIDSMLARTQRSNAAGAPGAGGAMIEGRQAAPGSSGGGTMIITVAPPAGGGGPPGPGAGGGGRPTGPTSVRMATPTILKAALADVPDYRPAFRQGAVRADAEGGLWIRTSAVADGRPVYDVVDGRGEVTARVQLPPFRTVAGFGPGVIYMAVQDSSGTAHLERARIR